LQEGRGLIDRGRKLRRGGHNAYTARHEYGSESKPDSCRAA
jgi:hypothetical protein